MGEMGEMGGIGENILIFLLGLSLMIEIFALIYMSNDIGKNQ
jgi:hypothetical protein